MIKEKFLNLWNWMEQKTFGFQEYLSRLGWFLIVTFPIFYIINTLIIGVTGYESIFLRISIGILGLILVFRNYLPENTQKKIMPIIFFGTIIYAFPFFFFFMLFNNQDSYIWKINVLSGLFFLSFFFNWKEFTIFSLLGFLLAWLALSLTSPNAHLPPDFISLAIIYTNPIVYLTLFFSKKDYLTQEKLNTMKVLAGSIAHELRTPLSALMMDVQYLAKYFPYYQDAYAQAREAELPIHKMSREDEADLAAIPKELQSISQNANTMITMLLTNLNEGTTDRRIEACSMKLCVEEALKTYPFSPNEKRIVHWQGKDDEPRTTADFTFLGHKELTKHVFYNLIKNALYAIASSGKGEIFITIDPARDNDKKSESMNKLIFKDTGSGISPDILRHIFDRFYTKTEHGAGIGLAFCQSVIQSFGGDIVCSSQQGEHTTFTIFLPVIKECSTA